MCAPNLYIFMHNTIIFGGRGGSLVSQPDSDYIDLGQGCKGGGKVAENTLLPPLPTIFGLCR